jgi:hypothetical protein
MNAKSRPSLASLSDRFARKEPAQAVPAPSENSSDTAAATAEPKDNRVQVLVRMTIAERKALRQIALDQDTTVQALVEETLRDLLRRHGRSDD